VRGHAEYLVTRIETGDIPSATWLVGEAGSVLDAGAAGCAVLDPQRVPAVPDTVYDLASLTKPLVTSLLALILVDEEGVDLDQPARRFLPAFASLDKREITLAHLLAHVSGLPDWAPLYAGGGSVEEYLSRIGGMEPVARPGTRVVYSDLGYIALGAILEHLGTAPLDRLARSFIFEPTGAQACFRPGPGLLPRVAATERECNYERGKAGEAARGYSGWRQGVIRGEVHDQNAWAVGGVAGGSLVR
jgi:CubicO group peptidase (beta-lactamase class C family)